MPKSKLFKRNMPDSKPGRGKTGAGLFAPRMLGGFRAPNPRPPRSIRGSDYLENKALTGTSATLALTQSGQCFHLDQIAQGSGVTQRTGQRTQITGVHIRGHAQMNNAADYDSVGYYLVWDKQPSEVLPNAGDILAMTGVDSVEAFPNLDTADRFIILARKTHCMANENQNDDSFNASMQWCVDDYYQFSRKLVTTTVIGGSGSISDRVSGALILLGVGHNPSATATNLTFNYRVYFNDV